MPNVFNCLSNRDERRREALRESVLREAHERNAKERQVACNEELYKQYRYQTGSNGAMMKRAHTDCDPSSFTHSHTSPSPQFPPNRNALRNPFEGGHTESYIARWTAVPSIENVRVGMVPARSYVPEPFYVQAQDHAERRWERAMPDVAAPPTWSHSRNDTSLPQPQTSNGQPYADTIHRSRSSEAPELHSPQQYAAEILRAKSTSTRQLPNRLPRPAGVCPPGWI